MTEKQLDALNRADLVAFAGTLDIDTGPTSTADDAYLNMDAIRALVLPKLEAEPPPPKEPTVAKYSPSVGQSVVLKGPKGVLHAARVLAVAGSRKHTHQNKRRFVGMNGSCCLEISRAGQYPLTVFAFPSPDGKEKDPEEMDIEAVDTEGVPMKTFFWPAA